MKHFGSIAEIKSLKFRDAAGFITTINIDAQTAARLALIPVLAGDDSFVMANATQTLTNKTLPTGNNNSFLGITDTVAGYLMVGENVQNFMTGVRTMTGYGGAKGDAWLALTSSDISNLRGTTSGIQAQFGTNTAEHVAISDRLTALEGGQAGALATNQTIINTDQTSVNNPYTDPWVFFRNLNNNTVTFYLRGDCSTHDTMMIRNDAGTLIVDGNTKHIDGVDTLTLAAGDWAWLRYDGTGWFIADRSPIAATQFDATQVVTENTSDTSTSSWVFVELLANSLFTYDLRAAAQGLTYSFANKSTTGALSTIPTGGALIDGAPALSLTAGDWVILHCDGTNFYVAARKASSGGTGFTSSTIEMTTATLSDTYADTLMFLEKTYVGEATFTLNAVPFDSDMRQIKNSSSGTLHIEGNGQDIDGQPQLTLEPTEWAWLRYRDTAWYVADRSPISAAAVTATFTSAGAITAGRAVMLTDAGTVQAPELALPGINNNCWASLPWSDYQTLTVTHSYDGSEAAILSMKSIDAGVDVAQFQYALAAAAVTDTQLEYFIVRMSENVIAVWNRDISAPGNIYWFEVTETAFVLLNTYAITAYAGPGVAMDSTYLMFSVYDTAEVLPTYLHYCSAASSSASTAHTFASAISGARVFSLVRLPSGLIVSRRNTSWDTSMDIFSVTGTVTLALVSELTTTAAEYRQIRVTKIDDDNIVLSYTIDINDGKCEHYTYHWDAVLHTLTQTDSTSVSGFMTGYTTPSLDYLGVAVVKDSATCAFTSAVIVHHNEGAGVLGEFKIISQALIASGDTWTFSAVDPALNVFTVDSFCFAQSGLISLRSNWITDVDADKKLTTSVRITYANTDLDNFISYQFKITPSTVSNFQAGLMTYPIIGIANTTVAGAGLSVEVLLGPIVTGLTGMTPSKPQYAGAYGTLSTVNTGPSSLTGVSASSSTLILKAFGG